MENMEQLIDFALNFKDWCDKQYIEVSKGEWRAKYPNLTDKQLMRKYLQSLKSSKQPTKC